MKITSLSVLLFAFCIMTTDLVARDLFVNNLEGYVVEPATLDVPSCAESSFENNAIGLFEQALCVFHRSARSAEDTDKTIRLMARAQTWGLPPVHQQFSALVTGLGHCSNASRHLDVLRSSNNEDGIARLNFCRARRLSSAELASMRWEHALFEYSPELTGTQTLPARLTEMSACYAGVLNPDFDAECGLVTNISPTEITAFVDDAAGVVIKKYFSGVESPITAMFQRKVSRTEGARQNAEQSIAELKTTAAEVNAELNSLNAVYIAARDERMEPIYNAYRESILRATAILDEFDRWKAGLFINAENVNLMPKIVTRGEEIQEELLRVKELEFLNKTTKLQSDVSAIIDSKSQEREIAGELCRIYFCELASRRNINQTIRACRQPALAGNPLCISAPNQLTGTLNINFAGEQSIEVGEFCHASGVDSTFTVLNMAPAQTFACLESVE